jgi:hypothetical protein
MLFLVITVATARITSTAAPAAFFPRWADMTTWPEWNLDTAWVELGGPFVTGATGVLKPKGSPKVPFVVERLVPRREFVDGSRRFGARLTFDHQLTATTASATEVTVAVTLAGPLARIWNRLLGRGIRESAPADRVRLARVAEGVRP